MGGHHLHRWMATQASSAVSAAVSGGEQQPVGAVDNLQPVGDPGQGDEVSPKVISLWDETGPCQAPPTASQATDGQDR